MKVNRFLNKIFRLRIDYCVSGLENINIWIFICNLQFQLNSAQDASTYYPFYRQNNPQLL